MSELGFSARWVAMETDLWILVFATHPATGIDLLNDRAQALADPELRQIYLDYDGAHDLYPADARVDELARRIFTATQRRYGTADLPGQSVGSDIPALVQGAVNALSPAWQRLDRLIRGQLGA